MTSDKTLWNLPSEKKEAVVLCSRPLEPLPLGCLCVDDVGKAVFDIGQSRELGRTSVVATSDSH